MTRVYLLEDIQEVDEETDSDISDCVICLDPMQEYTYYQFDCGHKMHKLCFSSYFEYHYDVENNFIRCPTCSANIYTSDIPSFCQKNTEARTISEPTIPTLELSEPQASPVNVCITYTSPFLLLGAIYIIVSIFVRYDL